MIVTYLGHSGFMVETDRAYYVFDYMRGEMPPFKAGKPCYVFASHRHDDHFAPEIITSPAFANVTAYYLSHDIARKIRRLLKNNTDERIAKQTEKIVWCREDEPCETSELLVSCLKSTDVGVAFVVEEKASGLSFYHAGDLNWWHWEEESKAYNRNMEVRYKCAIDSIAGCHFSAAFVPLDPHLEEAYNRGMDYFLEKCSADIIFPMHMWDHYEWIGKYVKTHPEAEMILTDALPKMSGECSCSKRETADMKKPGDVLVISEDENSDVKKQGDVLAISADETIVDLDQMTLKNNKINMALIKEDGQVFA